MKCTGTIPKKGRLVFKGSMLIYCDATDATMMQPSPPLTVDAKHLRLVKKIQ